MKKVALLAVLAAAAVLLLRGGETREKAMREAVGAFDEIVAAVESVSDEATARQAADRIKGASPRLKAALERVRDLKDQGETTPAEDALRQDLDKAGLRFKEALTRMKGAPLPQQAVLAAALMGLMADLSGLMQ